MTSRIGLRRRSEAGLGLCPLWCFSGYWSGKWVAEGVVLHCKSQNYHVENAIVVKQSNPGLHVSFVHIFVYITHLLYPFCACMCGITHGLYWCAIIFYYDGCLVVCHTRIWTITYSQEECMNVGKADPGVW